MKERSRFKAARIVHIQTAVYAVENIKEKENRTAVITISSDDHDLVCSKNENGVPHGNADYSWQRLSKTSYKEKHPMAVLSY